MDIHEKYVVYEMNKVMSSDRHLALEEVTFKGSRSNSFETIADAIKALDEDKKHYQSYLIIKQVYIN